MYDVIPFKTSEFYMVSYKMKVLVTGGTGLVGNAIRTIKPEWTYINSSHCDLSVYGSFDKFLKDLNIQFDAVIHLAANVGGLFKNMNHKVKMFEQNLLMNMNVVEACRRHNIPRMICCLSTCVFPDGLDSDNPMTESDLHKGEPHDSNFGYAYAKRILDVHCRLINESDPTKRYQSIIPCNIYGPHDNFQDPENAHVVPALITKCAALKELDCNTLNIKGSGNPMRQFIYSADLAHIIVDTVVNDLDFGPDARLICAPEPHVEYSIKHVAGLIAKQFDIDNVVPENNTESINDGQKSKTCSNARLHELFDITLTSLEDGIETTCNWYKVAYLYSKFQRS